MSKELSNAEKLIQLEDKGAAALNNAETPEQRDSIAKNLKKMMGNFTKADRTEAAKLRAEMEGQDTDEELFPLRKSMGGLMNQSLLDSQDFNKDTGFPSVGPAAPALAPRESSITAERGSPTTDFPGDQMKKSLLTDERQPYAFGGVFDKEGKLRSTFRDAYGDLEGDWKSDAKTILGGALDLTTGANRLKTQVGMDAISGAIGNIVNSSRKRSERSTSMGTGTSSKKGKVTIEEVEDKAEGGLLNYAEGSLMVPPEMEALESDMPADTYPNIPPEEMAEAEASQLPDEAMEDEHMEFVFEESLDDEEQSYLMNALEGDPKLSQIFDKVLTTASEFTGSGKVEGPGTGVSDSIPARLSDGEFVMTDKATEEIGSDNLQTMMDDAERAYDGGAIRKPAQEGGLLLYKGKDEDPLAYEKTAQDEIKKSMLRSNRAPSLNPG